MSTPSDRELLSELLELPSLSETQREAFQDMAEYLDGGDTRKLTVKQHNWVRSASVAAGIVADEALNLFSSGRVPVGIATPKSAGELAAIRTLSVRPAKPPGRSA